MITVEELSKYLMEGTVESSRRVVLEIYPYHNGTAFKLSGCREELFISECVSRMCFHSAHSRLAVGHPFEDRCYFIKPLDAKDLGIGILV